MLIAALIIWLVLLVFVVMLCRVAAAADGRDAALTERYPSGPSGSSAPGARTLAAGLVVWEEQPALVLADLRPADPRARVPGARGRAERYAAGS